MTGSFSSRATFETSSDSYRS